MSTHPAVPAASDPFPTGLQRVAALSGVAFVVLVVLAAVMAGDSTPDWNAPVAEWSEYARDSESDSRIGALIFGLAVFEFIWFLGYLREALGRAETAARGFARLTHVAYGGGLLAIAGMGLAIFLSTTALSHPEDTSGEIIRALTQMSGGSWALASVGFGALFTATRILILRAGGFARWIGIVSLAAGILSLLQLGVLLSEEYDNGFGFAYPLGFLAMLITVAACSVTFFRRVGRPAPAADAPLPPATAA